MTMRASSARSTSTSVICARRSNRTQLSRAMSRPSLGWGIARPQRVSCDAITDIQISAGILADERGRRGAGLDLYPPVGDARVRQLCDRPAAGQLRRGYQRLL